MALGQTRELKCGSAPPGRSASTRFSSSWSPGLWVPSPAAGPLHTHPRCPGRRLHTQHATPVVCLSLSHTHTSLTHPLKLSAAHGLVSLHHHLYMVLPFQSEITPGVLRTVNKTRLWRERRYLSLLWLTGLCEPIHRLSSDLEFPVQLRRAVSWTHVTVGGDLSGASGNRPSSAFMGAVFTIPQCSWERLLGLAHSAPSRPHGEGPTTGGRRVRW